MQTAFAGGNPSVLEVGPAKRSAFLMCSVAPFWYHDLVLACSEILSALVHARAYDLSSSLALQLGRPRSC